MADGNLRDSDYRQEIIESHLVQSDVAAHGNGFTPNGNTVVLSGVAHSETNGESFKFELLDELEASKIKEEILAQIPNSHLGYIKTVESLNKLRPFKSTETASEDIIRVELKNWLTPDRIVAVALMKEKYPFMDFTLVATPNVLVNAAEAKELFRTFNDRPAYWTDYDNPLYDHYSPEQISGTNPGNQNAIQFSLIPNRLDPEIYGTVRQHLDMLLAAQQINPYIRTSSIFEDITYFNTLLASGKDFQNNGLTTEETFMLHFDLPAILIDDGLQVPAWLKPATQIIDEIAYLGENIIDQPENARHLLG